MRINTAAPKDGTQTIEVSLTAEETREYLDPFFQKKAEEEGIQVEEGSNPRRALSEKIGHSEVGKMANQCVFSRSRLRAIDESGLEFLTIPECSAPSFATAGYSFKYTMTGIPLPKLALTSYEPIELLDIDFTVTDERFDKEFQKLVDDYADIVPAEGLEQAQAGTIVQMDMTSRCDGEPYEDWTAIGALHQIGSGQMPADFDKALTGIKPGDAKMIRFNGVLLADPSTTHAFESYVVCTGLYTFAPATPSDEWVRANFDQFETLEELKTALRRSMEAEAEASDKTFDDYYLATMLSLRLSSPIPSDLLKSHLDNTYDDFKKSLEKAGITEEEAAKRAGLNVASQKDRLFENATESLKQGLALDALARQLKLKPGKAELIACADEITGGHGKEFYEVVKEAGGIMPLRMSARRNMAAAWLKEHAVRKASKKAIE